MAEMTSILTKGQREYLREEKEPENENHERTIRNRIKSRVQQGFSDIALLQQEADNDLRTNLFKKSLETGPIEGDPYTAGHYRESLTRVLAFIFHGLAEVYDTSELEQIIEEALKFARNDRLPPDEAEVFSPYQVTIERKSHRLDTKNPMDLDKDEATEVLKAVTEAGLLQSKDIETADEIQDVIESVQKSPE